MIASNLNWLFVLAFYPRFSWLLLSSHIICSQSWQVRRNESTLSISMCGTLINFVSAPYKNRIIAKTFFVTQFSRGQEAPFHGAINLPSEIELNLEILIISFVIECCGLTEIQEKRYRERETSVARRLATKNWLKFKPLFPSFVRGYTEEIACIRVKLNCYNVTIIDCSNSTKWKVEILAKSEDSFRDEMITGNRKIQHG